MKKGPPLVKYDAARKALAEAHRVDEAKEIRDKAVAIVAYARQAQDRDMITWASEIKIRAERRTGELLRETAKAGQRRGRGGDQKSKGSHVSIVPTLKDLRISPDQAKDWQGLAKIPEPEFEQRLAHAGRDPKTMTTEKILRPVRQSAEDPFEPEREIWAGVAGWLHGVTRLPKVEQLKEVRPTGGSRMALGGYYREASTYMEGLERLQKEGWF